MSSVAHGDELLTSRLWTNTVVRRSILLHCRTADVESLEATCRGLRQTIVGDRVLWAELILRDFSMWVPLTFRKGPIYPPAAKDENPTADSPGALQPPSAPPVGGKASAGGRKKAKAKNSKAATGDEPFELHALSMFEPYLELALRASEDGPAGPRPNNHDDDDEHRRPERGVNAPLTLPPTLHDLRRCYYVLWIEHYVFLSGLYDWNLVVLLLDPAPAPWWQPMASTIPPNRATLLGIVMRSFVTRWILLNPSMHGVMIGSDQYRLATVPLDAISAHDRRPTVSTSEDGADLMKSLGISQPGVHGYSVWTYAVMNEFSGTRDGYDLDSVEERRRRRMLPRWLRYGRSVVDYLVSCVSFQLPDWCAFHTATGCMHGRRIGSLNILLRDLRKNHFRNSSLSTRTTAVFAAHGGYHHPISATSSNDQRRLLRMTPHLAMLRSMSRRLLWPTVNWMCHPDTQFMLMARDPLFLSMTWFIGWYLGVFALMWVMNLGREVLGWPIPVMFSMAPTMLLPVSSGSSQHNNNNNTAYGISPIGSLKALCKEDVNITSSAFDAASALRHTMLLWRKTSISDVFSLPSAVYSGIKDWFAAAPLIMQFNETSPPDNGTTAASMVITAPDAWNLGDKYPPLHVVHVASVVTQQLQQWRESAPELPAVADDSMRMPSALAADWGAELLDMFRAPSFRIRIHDAAVKETLTSTSFKKAFESARVNVLPMPLEGLRTTLFTSGGGNSSAGEVVITPEAHHRGTQAVLLTVTVIGMAICSFFIREHQHRQRRRACAVAGSCIPLTTVGEIRFDRGTHPWVHWNTDDDDDDRQPRRRFVRAHFPAMMPHFGRFALGCLEVSCLRANMTVAVVGLLPFLYNVAAVWVPVASVSVPLLLMLWAAVRRKVRGALKYMIVTDAMDLFVSWVPASAWMAYVAKPAVTWPLWRAAQLYRWLSSFVRPSVASRLDEASMSAVLADSTYPEMFGLPNHTFAPALERVVIPMLLAVPAMMLWTAANESVGIADLNNFDHGVKWRFTSIAEGSRRTRGRKKKPDVETDDDDDVSDPDDVAEQVDRSQPEGPSRRSGLLPTLWRIVRYPLGYLELLVLEQPDGARSLAVLSDVFFVVMLWSFVFQLQVHTPMPLGGGETAPARLSLGLTSWNVVYMSFAVAGVMCVKEIAALGLYWCRCRFFV